MIEAQEAAGIQLYLSQNLGKGIDMGILESLKILMQWSIDCMVLK